MRIIKQLNEPFPDRANHVQNLLSLFGVGLFVSLFLYILRPFGIQHMGEILLPVCLGFGGVTVLFGWLFDLVCRYLLRIRTDMPSWTLWKWILQAMILIVWVAFGNYLFMNALMGWNSMQVDFLLQMLGYTIVIGIFPVVFSGLTIQLRAAKLNRENAGQIEISRGHRTTVSSVDKTVLQLPGILPDLEPGQLRYIEAMQNYITIYYIDQDQLKKEVVRATIAGVEAELDKTSIIRCHRSYLVNLNAIEQVSGNAQGLKLRLDAVPGIEIPVSRPYIPILRDLFN